MVVVMDQGRIEQAGTAHAIYTLPRSAYVARFMGGQNVLSGTVAAVANGIARLVSDSGEHYAVLLSQQVAVHDTVFFSMRRDHITLEKAAQHGDNAPAPTNAICGRVHAVEYQGAYVKVTIERPGQEDFVAHLADRDFFTQQLAIGDRVMARWSLEAIHLLQAEHSRTAGRTVVTQPYGEEFNAPAS
jgi:putative spermidine/putrescine transport system ATP-binding protein